MKRFTPKFKAQFIGLSKKEAMALLESSKGEYNIKNIDYFESKHGVPKVIYVNYGMALELDFDKHSRRIVFAY